MTWDFSQDEQTILNRLDAFKEKGRLLVDINHTGINVTAVMVMVFLGLMVFGGMTGLMDPLFSGLMLVFFLGLFFQIGLQFRAMGEMVAKQQACLLRQEAELEGLKADSAGALSDSGDKLLKTALFASRSRFMAKRQ